MLKSLTLATALVSIIAGCSREESPRRLHETAALGTANEQTSSETLGSAPVLKAFTTSEISDLQKDAPDFAVQLEERLGTAVLETDLRSPSPTKRNEMFKYVQHAARMVDALKPQDFSRKKVLAIFTRAMTEGCNDRLQNCRFTSLFQEIPGSTTLLLAAAEEARNDIRQRYRILGIAFASVGRRDEPRLLIAYLETAEQFQQELLKKNDQQSRIDLQQHREIVDESLTQLKSVYSRPSKSSLDLLSKLESSLDVWNLDRVRNLDSTTRDEAVLSLVANKMFAPETTPATLSRQFAQTAAISKSAMVKLAKISKASRAALGIREELPENIHTFIFDNLWMGRITANESDILWRAYLSNANLGAGSFQLREDAENQLLNYARTRLLLSARDANSILIDFFNTKGTFATADALNEGLKESVKGEVFWTDSMGRFEALRQFKDRNLRTSNEDDPSAKELVRFFAAIPRNIKLLSTYPSMLVMSYHLARLGFSLNLGGWAGGGELQAGQILDWFFSGALAPWMKYGSDFRKLTKSEISMVFFYALEMGTITDGGVNIEDLFKMLTEQMTGPIRANVEKIDEVYRSSFDIDPTAGEFYRLCRQIDVAAASRKTFPVPKSQLIDLQLFSMAGLPQPYPSSTPIHPTFAAGWNLFVAERKVTMMAFDENLETLRLELTPKITRLRMLADVANDYLTRQGSPNREATAKSVDLKIRPLEELRKRTYSRFFRLIKQTGACSEALARAELTAQEHVIRGLTNHLRDVHGEMKNFRAKFAPKKDGNSPVNRQFGFHDKVPILGLAEHEQGLGFTADAYRMSRLQTLLRIAEILEKGFSAGGVKVAPLRDSGSILIPAKIRDLNEDLRLQTVRLAWNSNVDEFIADGLQQIFDPTLSFIQWSVMNSFGVAIKTRVRSMAALAKAGDVDTDSGIQRVDPKEIIRLSLVMQKWLEVDSKSEWMRVLNLTGEFTRVDLDTVLDDFAWDTASHEWRGPLDFAFSNLTSDKLGSVEVSADDPKSRSVNRVGPLAEFRQHSVITRTFDEPTLKIPAATMTRLTELYTKTLDVQMRLAGKFIDEANRLEPLRRANPSMFPSWRLFISRKNRDLPLLSGSAFEFFRSKMAEYRLQTGYEWPESMKSALDKR